MKPNSNSLQVADMSRMGFEDPAEMKKVYKTYGICTLISCVAMSVIFYVLMLVLPHIRNLL